MKFYKSAQRDQGHLQKEFEISEDKKNHNVVFQYIVLPWFQMCHSFSLVGAPRAHPASQPASKKKRSLQHGAQPASQPASKKKRSLQHAFKKAPKF